MRIDVASFYPEGVAIDAASNTLFVGSFGTGRCTVRRSPTASPASWSLRSVSAARWPASGSFGFNGIEMAPDASAVLVGRADTGEIVRVPVEPDGAAGAATTDTMPGPVSYGGVGGRVAVLQAVRRG